MIENTPSLSEVFNLQNFIIYLIIINLFTFFIMWVDKKKAEKNKWRISEQALFGFAIIGGSIGAIAGMYKFRHKTKKKRFTVGLPIILIIQIILLIIFYIP